MRKGLRDAQSKRFRAAVRRRQWGPITYVAERLFKFAACLSIANLLYGTREDRNRSGSVAGMRRRVRQIDRFVLSWLASEIALICIARSLTCLWPLVALASGYRIFDIAQSAFNVVIFDGLRNDRTDIA